MHTYPDSVKGIVELKNDLQESGEFPCAKELSETLVTIPVHPFLSKKDNLKILNMLNRTL